MTDPIVLALSLAFGLLLGFLYFYGLWLTLRRLPDSNQPALLSVASFLGRSIVCILGFYLIMGSGLFALISGIAGFVIAKVILITSINRRDRSDG